MSTEPPNNQTTADFPADDLIEIHDPEIDPQAIMTEIRRRIQARRAEAGYENRTFPAFGSAMVCPEPPEGMPYSPDLYHHLRQVNALYSEVETNTILAPSPATRVPILGHFWRMIREQAHGLVLFYVNRSVAHQVKVNRHLVSVLNQLTEENQALQRRVMVLEAEAKRPHE
ncbi:MAG: hypothetical protein WAM60_12995 [Candidatus Promineifilaceae bacterium]